MMIWIDAQLSPSIAHWIIGEFGFESSPLRDLGLRDAEDLIIFNAARQANAIILTKDKDFVLLLEQFGPPPRIIWLACGNTSNSVLKTLLSVTLAEAVRVLEDGESIVEVS
jgi:predicted nuclease of predicted toxin-antitoxin system